jgi:hypothetical protein
LVFSKLDIERLLIYILIHPLETIQLHDYISIIIFGGRLMAVLTVIRMAVGALGGEGIYNKVRFPLSLFNLPILDLFNPIFAAKIISPALHLPPTPNPSSGDQER